MSDEINAGFTVKEMLVRLETKVDVILADHETRLRRVEERDAQQDGNFTNREKFGAKVLALGATFIALAGVVSQAVYYATH